MLFSVLCSLPSESPFGRFAGTDTLGAQAQVLPNDNGKVDRHIVYTFDETQKSCNCL